MDGNHIHGGPLSDEDIAAVTQYVHEHIAQLISVDELAAVLGMSGSCFARLFKQAIGTTPHQFVLEQRVRTATEILVKDGGVSIAEAAIRCGFADQSHMTRVFRQLTGETPASFRRTA